MTSSNTNDTTLTKRGRGRPPKARTEAENDILDLFLTGVEVKVQDRIDKTAGAIAQAMKEQLYPLIEEAKAHRKISIVSDLGEYELAGLMHKNFEKLLRIATTRMPSMLVGPAGTGKTYASEQAAKALNLDYYAMSVGSQTSKTDIVGYMSANGQYVSTQFRQAYENGGIFLMDEIDAGNSNVLIVVNAGLSGTQMAFPDKMVQRHPDFIFIATANTFGMGANRLYVGRNQLDAATLDRFVQIDWEVDEALEASLVAHLSNGARWHRVVQSVRKMVEEAGYRVVVSPRATQRGATLLEIGIDFDEVVQMELCSKVGADQKERIAKTAKDAWR